MRSVTFTILSLFFVWQIQAQHSSIQFKNTVFQNQLSSSNESLRKIKISFPAIEFMPIETPAGNFSQLVIPGTYRSGKPGEPQLLSFQKIIAVPFGAKLNVKVTNYQTAVYSINQQTNRKKIIPYQESVSKNEEISQRDFVMDTSAYAKNRFVKQAMASVTELGIMRGMRLVKISVNPMQYNPAANQLKVFNPIELEISFVDANEAKTKQELENTQSPFFTPLYNQFIPTSAYPLNPDLVHYPVRYLLVAPGEFLLSLQDFITWKTQKGFELIVGNTDSIGFTAEEITNWIQTQYTDTIGGIPAPSFVLLVGDVAQIPASKTGVASNKATDLYYASMDGDMFPEMYYGRIPAQDTIQLKGMLNKILMYEKYQFPDDSFLDQVTLIAGADPTYNISVAQPTIKYGTENYFNSAHGFSTVNAYLSSYTGCYASDKIGVSLINYTAHCSQTTWGNPYLSASTVSSYTNVGKYPVAVGNCCTSGDFSINTCIGEAFVRNPNGGAIGYLGSVPDTYWWEDFYWAVGAHDPVYNAYPSVDSSSMGVYDAAFNSEYQCLDALLFAGNLAVTEAHNLQYDADVSSLYYWEAYHCLGDPSLVPYFTKGLNPVVSHSERLESGLGEFLITAEPGSLVTLSANASILDSKMADASGNTVLYFDKNLTTDSVQLVVTCPKYKPYIKTLPVTVSQSSYLALKAFSFNDSLGNINNLADFGEVISLGLLIENIGDSLSQNIRIELLENNPYVTLLTHNFVLNTSLSKQQASLLDGYFYIKVADSIPDQETVTMTITLSDSVPGNQREYYVYQRTLLLNAPQLSVLPNLVFNDFAANGNELPDMGEVFDITVGFVNSGHATVSATVMLESLLANSHFNFLNATQVFNVCLPNDTLWTSFSVQMDENPMLYPKDTIRLTLGNGRYQAVHLFPLTIGGDTIQEFGSASYELSDYPFNNYYKNNKTQILFKSEELAAGIKAVKTLAFNFSQITPNVNNRDLVNLQICMKTTDLEALNAFEVFTDETLVFDSSLFYLPASTGWFTINLDTLFIPESGQNVLLQISWGTNNDYPEIYDRSKVFGSLTDYISVAYGFDDDLNPPDFYAAGNLRPDVQFGYDSVSILNILVQGDLPLDTSLAVANAKLQINGKQLIADASGKTKYISNAYSETLEIITQAYGYRDSLIAFENNASTSHLNIMLERNPQSIIQLKDTWMQAIADANVLINDYSFNSNSQGLVPSFALASGQAAYLSVSKPGYLSLDSTLTSFFPGDTIDIQLAFNWADLSLHITDSKEQAVSNAMVYIEGLEYQSDDVGQVQIPNLFPGSHTLFIYHPDYVMLSDTLCLGALDTTIAFHLSTVGTVAFTLTDTNQILLPDIEVHLGNQIKAADRWGFVQFEQVVEGIYPIQIFDSNYYPYTDSLLVFGTLTSKTISLQNKPDLSLYFHNGYTAESDVEVWLGSTRKLSDTNGFVVFTNVDTGLVSIVANKQGFYNNNIQLVMNTKDTLLNVSLQKLPQLTFAITDSSGPVANLPVLLDSVSLISNALGHVVFDGIAPGIHLYQINRVGYYSINAQLWLDSTGIIKDVFLHEIPDINWKLSYKNTPVDSVKITCNGEEYFTNTFGEFSLNDVESGNYSYTLSKAGYETQNGTISVTNKDVALHLTMPKLARLVFNVESNGQPIPDAHIIIDTFAIHTDSEGVAIIETIAQGTYLYSVYKQGYFIIADTLVVDSEIFTNNVWLEPEAYAAIFTLNNGVELLSGVEVILDTMLAYTNTQGKVAFYNLEAGKTYPYKAKIEGYESDTGTIFIDYADVSQEITLDLITHNVLFKVFDQNGPLALATINFDNKIKTSNVLGEALFNSVIPADSLIYLIKKVNTHQADTGWVKLTSDTTLNVWLIAIGVDEDLARTISLYPNPTQAKVKVSLLNKSQIFTCKVFNNRGDLLFNANQFKGEAFIDLSAFSSGVYFIHIESNGSYAIKSIVRK
jgi:hypothetical protein